MKYITTICLILFLALPSAAQYVIIADDSSYAATDTTATVEIEKGNCVLGIWFKDSVNVAIAVDYRNVNSTVWATYNAEADSTNSTVAAGMYKGYVLRYGSTNNIPGANRLRLRIVPKTTLNGTTSPTYDAWLDRD